ncbi:5-oxoprolinase subunit B family protein [Ilumatobacter sp.]|uniref:5-oxoprolinase subunit B family protein n=1 Tax=Ilumatobacter sp. TaxID=1967498 RepID=UPI003AF6C4B5
MPPTYTPIADHALLVEFATEIGDDANAAVVSLDRAIARQTPTGVVEVVPAFVNLLVDFDPTVTDHPTVESAVRELLAHPPDTDVVPRDHVVQVCYEGAFAPDLAAVAERSQLSVEAVIDAHLAGEYRVVMYGFAPGYAYMAGVADAIQVPRKPAPIRGVAAGSVIIAGPQCLVTTIEMPTGWSIIGRSPTRVLRPEADRPFLFDPGDRVTFERVDPDTFERQVRAW